MRTYTTYLGLILAAAFCVGASGCADPAVIYPNPDLALRKPAKVFAADASKRHYEADAPKAPDSDFRSQYALILRRIDLANISDHDCSDVEVWINGKYVLYCPTFEKKSDKSLAFAKFFDDQGHRFDTQGGKNQIESIEVYRDGTMYSVVTHVAD